MFTSSDMSRSYALVLFDIDGCTAVVDVKKLQCDVRAGVVGNLRHAGQLFKVEILRVSESKKRLNNYEADWADGERAAKLDEYKRQNCDVVGGYLAIQQTVADVDPTAEETEETEDQQPRVTTPVLQEPPQNRQVREEIVISEHRQDKRSFGTQTDPVIVIDSLAEVIQSFACGKCASLEGKLDRVMESIQDLRTAMDNKALPTDSFLDNIAPPTTAQAVVITDLGQDCAAVQEGHENDEHLIAEKVDQENIFLPPLPSSSPVTVSTFQQGIEGQFTQPCTLGPILEIMSPEDVVGSSFQEIRVHPEVLRSVSSISCSVGNFGWQLVKRLFTEDEIVGRNYSGRKGKNQLSPRRIHAIEHASAEVFGKQSSKKALANSINGAIRNLRKKNPLKAIQEL